VLGKAIFFEGGLRMDQYVGEIRLFAGDYAPDGWALCNG